MNTAGLSPVITMCGPKSAECHRVRRVHLLETSERYIAIKRSGLVLGLVLIAESLPVACDVRCPHVK